MLSWIVDQERPHEAITAALSAGSGRGPRNDGTLPIPFVPAQAGTQGASRTFFLDSRLRGNERDYVMTAFSLRKRREAGPGNARLPYAASAIGQPTRPPR